MSSLAVTFFCPDEPSAMPIPRYDMKSFFMLSLDGPSPGLGITNFLRRGARSQRVGGIASTRLAKPRANLTARAVRALRERMYSLKRNLGPYGVVEDWYSPQE